MKTRAVLAVLLMLVCSIAVAEEEKLPMDLPIYPSGESTMEMNITSADILPMLSAMLPLAARGMGKLAEAISPEEVASILADVRRIQVLQLDVPKPKVTEAQIASYYAANLPQGRWSRVFWQTDSPKGTMALYSQKDTEQLFGFHISSVQAEGKQIERVEVVKIEGKIDYAKIITMAAKLFSQKAAGK